MEEGRALGHPVSVEEARAIIEAQFIAGGLSGDGGPADARPREETIEIRRAAGRVLARAVDAREDIPPFANSAMDGYAVHSDDIRSIPARVEVVGESRTGTPPPDTVSRGSCVRIMTGAPMPPGCDAVVPVEWTQGWIESGAVIVTNAVERGMNVRTAGGDVTAGSRVFEAGDAVTPPVVGMLAAMGFARVNVYRRPTVAIVASGDELVSDGSRLGPGQIRNSNGPGLAAQARWVGADVVLETVAGDEEDAVRAAISRGLEADILLISGGVSVGLYDYVRGALEAESVSILFWRVQQRPGRPLAFGRSATAAAFGLPGNPVSSAICFEQYVKPAIRIFQGGSARAPLVDAVLDERVEKKVGLHYFSRGKSWLDDDGTRRVHLAGEQGSNIYSSMVRSNCIVHLPAERGEVSRGETVGIEPYAWSA